MAGKTCPKPARCCCCVIIKVFLIRLRLEWVLADCYAMSGVTAFLIICFSASFSMR